MGGGNNTQEKFTELQLFRDRVQRPVADFVVFTQNKSGIIVKIGENQPRGVKIFTKSPKYDKININGILRAAKPSWCTFMEK